MSILNHVHNFAPSFKTDRLKNCDPSLANIVERNTLRIITTGTAIRIVWYQFATGCNVVRLCENCFTKWFILAVKVLRTNKKENIKVDGKGNKKKLTPTRGHPLNIGTDHHKLCLICFHSCKILALLRKYQLNFLNPWDQLHRFRNHRRKKELKDPHR